MPNALTREIIALDKAHLWHPFTDMAAWCAADHEPLVIESGKGVYLLDSEGRRYLDGNSSIWTNIHGHGHPRIVSAIQEQAERLAHCSALGTSNIPASRLAAELCRLWPESGLSRVFYSDDGSTAVECALRMALQYWQMRDQRERRVFACFDQAYHGDTTGAAALGGIARFHGRFAGLGVPVQRCASMEELAALPRETVTTLAAVVLEPLIQGAAGMKLWPEGMLRELRVWADENEVLLIFDEVMTGFGRSGPMFACQHEGVAPDFLCLAKGLSGGSIPLAATLTSEGIFQAFRGPDRTFYHGHSYCGNPLGCAAALANLAIFREENTLAKLRPKISLLANLLADWKRRSPHVREVRQLGLIAGIDLADTLGEGTGAKVCQAARAHGLLTRPIRNTLVFMPPLAINEAQLAEGIEALARATNEVFV